MAKTIGAFEGAKKQKGIARKLRYIHYSLLAKKNGVIGFRRDRIASEYVDDYFAETGVLKKEKEWFYRRGIPTFKVRWDGLTKENYNDYISDFDFYHKSNYMNTQFEKWFENKLNTYFLLAPFKTYMPKHYYYVHQGIISPVDVENKKDGTVEDILCLIKQKPIAAKACYGGHGKGFYGFEYRNGGFLANGKEIAEQDLKKLINGFHSYIITDFSIPHSRFRELCGDGTFAVIRSVSVYDAKDGGQVTSLIIRLGTKETGYVTDYDGTIYCGIGMQDGHLFNAIQRSGDKEGIMIRRDIQNHPDTGAAFDSFVVPNFDELKKLVKDIAEYVPMTPYLVMDIIPTETGFNILEINSHGQVRNVEPFYPFNRNKYNREVFHVREW